jgi:hypothetical protein
VLRPLYLQLHEAASALATGGAAAAGEASAAACRLVSLFDGGLHAPVAWLEADARATELGTRLASWLDNLRAAAAGDEAARRRAEGATELVLRTLAEPIRQRLGAVPWLSDPTAYVLRPPR